MMKGEAADLEIRVRDNNVEKALKTLKRKLGKEGVRVSRHQQR